ncbi:MAG: exo-alpha-sialidase [Bacteroidota bacterium]
MKKILFIVAMFTAQFCQAQWEPDVRLTNDPGISGTSYNNARCIAASGDTVHVVWEDNRNGQFEVYYKRSIDGGVSWGSDLQLTNSLNPSQKPTIAVSGLVVHVFWYYHQWTGNFEIYYKRSADGGQTWGSDTQLTNANGNSWEVSAAASGSTVHVVWEDSRDSLFLNTEIYYKRSIDGGLTWDDEVQLSDDPYYSGFPSIAASGSFVHVVWDDNRIGSGSIYYKRSTDEGLSWGEEICLTNGSGDSWMPCVAASATGVHVAWCDWNDGLQGEIYYRHSTDNGITWEAIKRLTNSFGDSLFPSISASGDNVHVVWFDDRLTTVDVFYNHSTDCGDCWNTEDLCLTNGDSYSTYPSIVAAGSAVHVVWTDFRDGNDEIYYKRNPTGNLAVGAEEILADNSRQSFTIYPNPASSGIHIRFNDNPTEKSFLTIRNILGETLIVRLIWNNNAVVDVSKLPNGLCFVEIATPNKQAVSRKLVIRK